MNPNRQPLIAALAVLTSIFIVMSAFSATITEDQINSFLTGNSSFPLQNNTSSPSDEYGQPTNETEQPPDSTGDQPILLEKSGTPEAIATNLAALETKLAAAPDCIIRKGWEIYITREGDTLEQLAQSHGVTPPIIQVGNCLVGSSLSPGSILYLPPLEGKLIPTLLPSPTKPVTATNQANVSVAPPGVNACPTQVTCQPECIPPSGWVSYFLGAGDTVPILSERFGVSIFAIQTANCLKPPLVISEGDLIYVPGATSTPTIENPLQQETPLPSTLQP
jgi:LysM repeat protein